MPKKNTQPSKTSQKATEEKVAEITSRGTIISALFGFFGVAIVAILSYLGSRPSAPVNPIATPSQVPLLAATVTPISTPDFGPISGDLVHESNGGVVWKQAKVSLRDFIVRATFINPYSTQDHRWNAVIFFRNGARVWINSDETWGYTGIGEQKLLPQSLLNHQAGERNDLELIVVGNAGCFYVNQRFVGDLDLSQAPSVGDVAVGISEADLTRAGAITHFEDFAISRVSQLNCPH